ncbi:cytochrome c551 [Mesobacillus foraminis]
MMLKKALMISGIVLGLTACSGGGGSEETSGGSGEVDTANAEEVFQQNCASCHGGNLEGGAGPALNKVGSDMSKDEILNKIKEGGGGMPANIIEGKNAESVAAWLAEKK